MKIIDDVGIPDESVNIEEDDEFYRDASIIGIQQLQQMFCCVCCKKGTKTKPKTTTKHLTLGNENKWSL